jgi:NADPH:quinone reductase
MTMKGILVSRLGASDVLEYKDLPEPVPEADQVLIEVRGASVNFADIKARSGGYHLARQPPFIPGLDIAGVVLEVGSKVEKINRGDHVIAFPASGSYAEKAVASQALTFVVPRTLDLVKAAAAALVTGTVIHMLKHTARIEKHENLLIHTAAGGVGTTALQVARALGVTEVYGSVGSSWKVEHAKNMGAIGVVDYASTTYGRDINRLTDGRGVDVILNPLGGATIERDLECLAPFGRLISFGDLVDGPGTIPQGELYKSNRSIHGSSFGHYRKNRPGPVRETMATVIDLLINDKITVFIDTCFRLKQASQAQQKLEDRKALGKLVLIPEAFYQEKT